MDIVISCVWIAIEISAMFLFNAAFLRRRFSKWKTLGIMLVLYILAIFHDLSVFYTIPPLASKAVISFWPPSTRWPRTVSLRCLAFPFLS